MIKYFFVLCTLTFLSLAFAWSGHEALTYLIVQDLPIKNRMVKITDYSYEENRIYNQDYLVVKDVSGERAFFDPLGDGKFPPDPSPIDGFMLPVWQILTIYSPEPDNGMDEGLQLDFLQGLIGNSQGVRHMKYNLGFINAFQGDTSFIYFVEMSRQAFKQGDRYWGYRFLARALHYAEDLSQPYHNAPGETGEVLWGIVDGNTRKILKNLHFLYDNYLVYLIYYSDDAARETILGSKPAFLGDERQVINSIMNFARSKFEVVHFELKKAFGDLLKTNVEMKEISQIDNKGELYILKGETLSILSYTASVIKGFLLHFLKEVGEIN
ncbi:hypothetical protein JYK00_00250 [Thermosipho ferrireducens]|uniref:Phospholipase n=1 Tax=Thermosipho ferrireducens TaxID=2571116 RepID=A0ABX7S7X8_9BACT|nr:hypothetical protein [Thermosipho ferrireducens]QTA38018.1 hypothetical protein JYK00_00250 [Thermosipho ferrireducens]